MMKYDEISQLQYPHVLGSTMGIPVKYVEKNDEMSQHYGMLERVKETRQYKQIPCLQPKPMDLWNYNGLTKSDQGRLHTNVM